jgi:hypothetical protein
MKTLRINRKLINIKSVFIAFLLLTPVFSGYGQIGHETFYRQSLGIQNTGMYVLGSWAVLNIAAGGYGWSQHSGKRMYFDQMNLFWNAVNISIAGFALYSNYNTDISLMSDHDMMAGHLRIENILLISTGFNIAYIGTGLLMRQLADRSPRRSDLVKGYGSSIILQGAFLFVFDLALYGFLRSHKLEFLENMNLAISNEMVGVRFILNL